MDHGRGLVKFKLFDGLIYEWFLKNIIKAKLIGWKGGGGSKIC